MPDGNFWNDEPVFSERAYSDIRGLVRRDRNHPSTFMWEPVLNETHFPKEYAHNAKKTVDEEYRMNKLFLPVIRDHREVVVFL